MSQQPKTNTDIKHELDPLFVKAFVSRRLKSLQRKRLGFLGAKNLGYIIYIEPHRTS